MAAPVITITRQYASGGSEIARLAARALSWEVIDNEFVEAVARRAGLPAEEVAQHDERAPGLLERLARTLAVGSPEMFMAAAAAPPVERDEATIVKMTERVIAEAAAHGRIVLVMRLAVEQLGVPAATVEKAVDEIDQRRDQYVKTYYGRARHDVVNYDLVVNAEKLGIEGAATLIVAEARRRGWK